MDDPLGRIIELRGDQDNLVGLIQRAVDEVGSEPLFERITEISAIREIAKDLGNLMGCEFSTQDA